MRIVSLVPGATGILCAIGLADELVGIADDPDPADIASLRSTPFVAHARRGPTGLRELTLDVESLVEAEPELVVAPRGIVLPAALTGTTLLTLDPVSVEGVFNAIATLGSMTSDEDAALELLGELRDRLGGLEARVRERADAGRAPGRVVVIEWLDPPLAAGSWVPELVRRAGGWDLLGQEGGDPTPTTWEAVAEVDPSLVIIAPRGLELRETVRRWAATTLPPELLASDAVRKGRVVAVDAHAYLESPGPGLIDGLALLAELMDPEGFVGEAPDLGWTPLS